MREESDGFRLLKFIPRLGSAERDERIVKTRWKSVPCKSPVRLALRNGSSLGEDESSAGIQAIPR